MKIGLMASIVLLIGIAGRAAGQVVAEPIILDQFQLDGSQQNQAIASSRSVGQTFTVGQNGILRSIELSLFALGSGGDLTIEMLDLSGGDLNLAPILGSVSIPPTALGPSPLTLDLNAVTATLIDLSSLGITVSEGDLLAFRLTTQRTLPNLYAIRTAIFSDLYSGGVYFTNNNPEGGTLGDAAFKTFVARPTIASVIAQVVSLNLNAGLKGSLTSKLGAAQRSLARGSSGAAINQLNAFINQVQALLLSGRLDRATAKGLIAAAQAIIHSI
jgi:hypothetical protein